MYVPPTRVSDGHDAGSQDGVIMSDVEYKSTRAVDKNINKGTACVVCHQSHSDRVSYV